MGIVTKYEQFAEIRFKHHYFFALSESGELSPGDCTDLTIKPSRDTEKTLKSMNIRFKETAFGFTLHRLLSTIKEDDQYVKKPAKGKPDSLVLYFELYVKNTQFLYYTNIHWLTFSTERTFEEEEEYFDFQNHNQHSIFYFSFNGESLIKTERKSITRRVGENDLITKIGNKIILNIPERTKRIRFLSQDGDYKSDVPLALLHKRKQIVNSSDLPDGIYKVQFINETGVVLGDVPKFKINDFFFKTNATEFWDLSGIIRLTLEDFSNMPVINIEFPARKCYWIFFVLHPEKYTVKLNANKSVGYEKMIYGEKITFHELDELDPLRVEYNKRFNVLKYNNQNLVDYTYSLFRSSEPIIMCDITRSGLEVIKSKSLLGGSTKRILSNLRLETLQIYPTESSKEFLIEQQLQLTEEQ